jgi:hypothetical protein
MLLGFLLMSGPAAAASPECEIRNCISDQLKLECPGANCASTPQSEGASCPNGGCLTAPDPCPVTPCRAEAVQAACVGANCRTTMGVQECIGPNCIRPQSEACRSNCRSECPKGVCLGLAMARIEHRACPTSVPDPCFQLRVPRGIKLPERVPA